MVYSYFINTDNCSKQSIINVAKSIFLKLNQQMITYTDMATVLINRYMNKYRKDYPILTLHARFSNLHTGELKRMNILRKS